MKRFLALLTALALALAPMASDAGNAGSPFFGGGGGSNGSGPTTNPVSVAQGGTGATSLGQCFTNSGSVLNPYQPINVQTGATYTIQTTDNCAIVETTFNGAVAITIPSASSAGFTAGFQVIIFNNGGAGTGNLTTVTNSGSGTIGQNTTVAVVRSQSITLVSDGTNWQPINGATENIYLTSFQPIGLDLNNTSSGGHHVRLQEGNQNNGVGFLWLYDVTENQTPWGIYGGTSSIAGAFQAMTSTSVYGWTANNQGAQQALDTGISRDSADVVDFGNGTQGDKSARLNAASYFVGSNNVGQAEQTISFQPGTITAISATKSAFGKFIKASTVDNIEGSAFAFTCSSNPTLSLLECGTSSTCASPTTIGTVTVTTSGTVVDGTISNAAIAAGDYVAWSLTAGVCTSIDIAGTAQVHSN